jgi:hypothetical protein
LAWLDAIRRFQGKARRLPKKRIVDEQRIRLERALLFDFRMQSNSLADPEYRRHSSANASASTSADVTKSMPGQAAILGTPRNVGWSFTGSPPPCAIGAQRQKGSRPFEGATSMGHFDNLASAGGRPH